MPARGSVETFLEAEEAANRVVEELSKLKTETESYRTARSALDKAGTDMARLAGNLADAAQRLDAVIQTLRNIGTPELLRAQEAALSEVMALRTELAEAHSAIDAGFAAQREALDAANSVLRATLDTVAQRINTLHGLAVVALVGLAAVGGLLLFVARP